MTRIILNADDFGRSEEQNQAIDDSFKQGLITSAGLIVTGEYTQSAIEYINKGGYSNNIHLHINLSNGLTDGSPKYFPLTEAIKVDPFFFNDGKFSIYKGLPLKFASINKWKVVYKEMVAQFEKFIAITNGEGDYQHLDFHLWYNLTWPVSLALAFFTKRFKIKSVRYIGVHQKSSQRFKLMRILSWNPRVRCVPSTNIDYYLSKRELFRDIPVIELYCHPNYVDGILLDDSPSYLKHDRHPLLEQIHNLKETDNHEFISWDSI